MTYTVIKSENYNVEIGEVKTLDEAVTLINDFNSKSRFPVENMEFEFDDKDDGLDAFGSVSGRLITFHTIKKAA